MASDPTLDDLRKRIRGRLAEGEATVVIRWDDGHVEEEKLVDILSPQRGGVLIGLTTDGKQLMLSPALEWKLLGDIGREEELQP